MLPPVKEDVLLRMLSDRLRCASLILMPNNPFTTPIVARARRGTDQRVCIFRIALGALDDRQIDPCGPDCIYLSRDPRSKLATISRRAACVLRLEDSHLRSPP
jgi:hypothetical protein